MPTTLSAAARNASLDGITTLVNGGTGAGVLRVYSGTQPANPDTAPTGTLLLEFDLDDPAFAAATGGSAALDVDPIPAATGLAAGTAGWCRLVDSDQAAATGLGVVDGEVTATGGGGLLELSTTTVSVGLDVTITGGSLTQPAS